MAPQWMPQNIQKRLLLYVLQQLSLFSEIDLPNLDVSLGSSSQVTLTDVEIDTDAFQIPGLYLRDGKVKNIKLQLNMSGGVSIEGDGLSITVAVPSSTSRARHYGTERSKFSLAQSTMDLANSIMIDENIAESDLDFNTPSQSFHAEIPTTGDQNSEPSTLNNMVTKAVEAALARLQVDIQNISIRLILDHATLDLVVKRLDFSTNDGVRSIKVAEISVVGVHPTVNPGEMDSTTEDTKSHNGAGESDNHFSSDEDDSDEERNKLMSSSILEKPKDLNESLVYSKEEASSIYMSAASDVFESRRQDANKAHLAFVNEAVVTFSGLSRVENLDVVIDEISIAATPIPLTLLHIIESFAGIGARDTYSRLPNLSCSMKDKDNADASPVEKQFPFKSLTVRKIALNVVSALLPNGTFFNPKELTLCCEHLELKYARSDIYHGALNKLYFIQNENVIGSFDTDSDKNDIRFELRANDFTFLLAKALKLDIDHITFQHFLSLGSLIPQMLDSLSRVKARQPIKKTSAGVTTLQTSAITINLKLNPNSSLTLKVAPISFDTSKGELSIKKLSLSKSDGESSSNLINVSNVVLSFLTSEKQFRSYDNTGHELFLLTKSILEVEKIQCMASLERINLLRAELAAFVKLLDFEKPETIFKAKKKARVSTNVMFQSRQSANLWVHLKSLDFHVSHISDKFGDVTGRFGDISVLLHRDGFFQLHAHDVDIRRESHDTTEQFLTVINASDKSAPILSVRTKNFKILNVMLRNSILDYYTRWISLFEGNNDDQDTQHNVSGISDSENLNTESTVEIRLSLVDSAIGLNPGRLQSKAVLVIPNGNLDVLIAPKIIIKSELRSSFLVLIDDIANIAGMETSRNSKATRSQWSQVVAYFNSKGFISVCRLKSLLVNILIKPLVHAESSSSVILDISSEGLDLDLCADSFQCLTQLLNDLKQPVIIKPDAKYKIETHGSIDVFNGIEENMFNGDHLERTAPSLVGVYKDKPISFVESYYDDQAKESSDLLSKDLSELAIKGDALQKNPFFAEDHDQESSSDVKSETSDSLLLLNEDHFQDSVVESTKGSDVALPMVLLLSLSKVVIKIYDGYDWKFTRKTISAAVKRLERKASEQREQAKQRERSPDRPLQKNDGIVRETLFDSIHVSLPVSSNPNTLAEIINKDIQNKLEDDTNGIDVGKKSNIKKLKLRRSKAHKVVIELKNITCNFNVLSNKDPSGTSSDLDGTDFEVLNELDLELEDFEVIDNVSTSTWNKFVSYMKDTEREAGSSMFKLNMKTVRPITSLAATEFLLNVAVLPLRLYVDQDTLEVLTRFGEFKDSRFVLIDEFEDIAYIQRFDVNAVHIKLDYKPKKIDYAGLKSGHTTEFMNFFILDEADMVLKQVTLHGISGFPKLGVALNGLWMPDIKATQLSGVLSGLAPVRSIAKIGSGFKDLIVVPVKEYKKDGRLYRSITKGVQQFSKTTTNELLKFGVKIAAGTQTFLENTEEVLGGTGSAARLVHVREMPQDADSEDIDDDDLMYDDGRFYGQSSQLIGRGSDAPLQRSVYQPTLESIVDINPPVSLIQTGHYQARRGSRRKVRNCEDDDDGFLEHDDEDDQLDGNKPRTVSLYADQPTNLKEGFLLAYDSFGRNLLVAKDAIINAGTEISESGSAHDTTMAVLKATPVVLLRPVIGVTEAASRALLGINNQLDPTQKDYTEDKYKRVKN
jgi:autophagy-related protein 2